MIINKLLRHASLTADSVEFVDGFEPGLLETHGRVTAFQTPADMIMSDEAAGFLETS